MSESGENFAWYKGKSGIIDSYLKESDKVRSEMASRNFSVPPGFMANAMTNIELMLKDKLSELNYKITADRMQVEVKDYKAEKNVDYNELANAWLIDKETLLSNMRKDIENMWYPLRLNEENAKRLAIEIEGKRVTIVNARAQLTEDLEIKKQQLDDARKLTLAKEAELAQAQVLTITKKLTLIPILEGLVATEEQILAKTTNELFPKKELLFSERNDLIESKEALIDPLTLKADKETELADAITEGIPILQLIAQEKVNNTLKRQTLLLDDIAHYDNLIDVEKERILLERIERESSVSMIELRQELKLRMTKMIASISKENRSFLSDIMSEELELITSRSQSAVDINKIGQDTRQGLGVERRNARSEVLVWTSNNDRSSKYDVAEAEAEATTTSLLKHVLS